MQQPPTDVPAALELTRAPGKAALASWIGSAVEYYDFFIYGTAAALVFGKIFFPTFDPQTATVAAFATFGVAYITRPLGAVALGHMGDKFGRKKVLTFTLLLMGVSTFLVGLLPTYDQIGILAPVLLVILRMLQGISAAGEQAGANSMTLEQLHLVGHASRADPGHAGVHSHLCPARGRPAELGLAPSVLSERRGGGRGLLGASHPA
jgi:MFS family permease